MVDRKLKWVSVFICILLPTLRVVLKTIPSLNFPLDIPSYIFPTYNYLEAEPLSTVTFGILFGHSYISFVSIYLVNRQIRLIHKLKQLLQLKMKSWIFIAVVLSTTASLPLTYISWMLWTALLGVMFQLLHSLPFFAGNIDNVCSGTFIF